MASKRAPKRPRSKLKPTPPSAPVRHLVEAFYHRKGIKGDPKAAERMRMLFEPISATQSRKAAKEGLSTHVFHHTCYSMATKRTRIVAQGHPWPSKVGAQHLTRVISSSLAMYRTLCLFPKAAVTHHNNNDQPFSIYLRHITTGHTIALGDMQGGFRFFTAQTTLKKVPKTFLRDIIRLMDVLVSDRCPHPQSGLVAGLVA